MRHRVLIALAVLGVASICLPADAQCKGRVTAGPVLWKENTDLKVESATDFDGSNNTTDQQQRDWEVLGSGAGMRVNYELPRLLSLYGELGMTQATVRFKDVLDPNQDVRSIGLDNGAYYTLGARLGDDFSNGKLFWTVGAAVNAFSTSLDQDITTSWDYDETNVSVDGRLGVWASRIGVYGGLRFADSSADLKETDRSNPLGQQTRETNMGRDGSVDLLIGARTRGSDVSGFTELGFVGTFSASAGLSMAF